MLTVPLDRLPHASHDRHAALRDYFCDKDAIADRDGKNWSLTLRWPDGEARHVDPRLDEGLAWWGGATSRAMMGLARRRSDRILTTLYDTWNLQGWSEWLVRHGSTRDITVLHVDDHSDLAPPRLFLNDAGWLDAITGARVDFACPASVRAAIESGAIGMGSFLTPFLHAVRPVQVRHLRQPPRTHGTFEYTIHRTTVADTLLRPGAPRPAITLVPQVGGDYLLTSDVDHWLADIGDGPVLLSISIWIISTIDMTVTLIGQNDPAYWIRHGRCSAKRFLS
jgi:hypothetical protein